MYYCTKAVFCTYVCVKEKASKTYWRLAGGQELVPITVFPLFSKPSQFFCTKKPPIIFRFNGFKNSIFYICFDCFLKLLCSLLGLFMISIAIFCGVYGIIDRISSLALYSISLFTHSLSISTI